MATNPAPIAAFYDFFSPFMQATILAGNSNKPEDRYPLWTNSISDAARKKVNLGNGSLAPGNLAFLQSVTVKMQLGFIPVITATLAPAYRDAIQFLNSSLVEFGSNTIEVQFGYASRGGASYLSPVYSGMLLLPDVQLGENVSIVLHGQGVGSFALNRSAPPTKFKGTSIKDIIKEIIEGSSGQRAKVSYVDDAEMLAWSKGAGDTGQEKIADLYESKTKASVVRTGKTDWQMMDELLNSCSCTYAILPLDDNNPKDKKFKAGGGRDKLKVFAKPSLYTRGDPLITLSLYDFPGQIGPSSGVYPILHAASPHHGVYAPGSAMRGLLKGGIDSADKKRRGLFPMDASKAGQGRSSAKGIVEINNVKQKQIASANAAAQDAIASKVDQARVEAELKNKLAQIEANIATAIQASNKTESGLEESAVEEFYHGDISNPDIDGKLRSEYSDQALNMGVKLDIETLGVPNILPGETVLVKGLSNRYDDVYSVFTVIHTLGPSGFTTKLEMYTNASKIIAKGVSASSANLSSSSANQKAVTGTAATGQPLPK